MPGRAAAPAFPVEDPEWFPAQVRPVQVAVHGFPLLDPHGDVWPEGLLDAVVDPGLIGIHPRRGRAGEIAEDVGQLGPPALVEDEIRGRHGRAGNITLTLG